MPIGHIQDSAKSGGSCSTIINEKGSGRVEPCEQGRGVKYSRRVLSSPIKGLGANSAELVALFPPRAPGSVLQPHSVCDFVLQTSHAPP